MSRIGEWIPDRIMQTFSVFPSTKVSDSVLEPYNATLSLHFLIERADQVIVIDNEALYDISLGSLKLKNPTYGDLNYLASAAISGITCSMRFSGHYSADLREIGINLVPLPRLHFFILGFFPLTARTTQKYRNYSLNEICSQIFDKKNMMCACDPRNGKYFTGISIFRGKMTIGEVDE